MLDFALFVVFCDFLFIIKEASGKPTLGVFVHFSSADLEFDDFFVWSDDGGVERLVTVLFWDGNIVFYSSAHRSIEGMNQAEGEITRSYVVDDDA